MEELNGFLNENEIYKNAVIERIMMIKDELKDQKHIDAFNILIYKMKEFDKLSEKLEEYQYKCIDYKGKEEKLKNILKMIEIISYYYDNESCKDFEDDDELFMKYVEKDELIQDKINEIKGLI